MKSTGVAQLTDGVGFHQVGIELVLADELAEAVADLGATVVSVLSIDRLGLEEQEAALTSRAQQGSKQKRLSK